MARVITKGLIGQEDINFGTGTFTRATSTGGTQTMTQVSGGAKMAGFADATSQQANLGAITFVTSPAVGLYRVSGMAIVRQAATTSSTLPSIVISWSDAIAGQTMTFTLTALDSGNALTVIQSGFLFLNSKVAQAINYSTTGYASSGGTPMLYDVHIRIEGPF